MPNTLKRLSAFEEAKRRQAMVSPYIQAQRQNRRAFWWFQVARNHIRSGSQHRELWLAKYAQAFGYNEFYFLLKSM